MKRSKTFAKKTERPITRRIFRNSQGQCHIVRDDGYVDGQTVWRAPSLLFPLNSRTAYVTTLSQSLARTELFLQSHTRLINGSLRRTTKVALQQWMNNPACITLFSRNCMCAKGLPFFIDWHECKTEISNCKPVDLYLFTFLLVLQRNSSRKLTFPLYKIHLMNQLVMVSCSCHYCL